jgi:class 3 adenylate cyclase/streptogramin lyase
MDRRGRHPRLAAVLFTDIVRSTETASTLGDRRWRELLSRHHRIIRSELKRYGGHEHDTAGDGFFASFSAPADAIRCAAACAAGVRQLGVEIRAGVNFGEVEMVDGKPGGLVVHAGARLLGLAASGQVLVSSSAHDVVPGAGIGFADLGEHRLKGLDAPMHVYSVTSIEGEPLAPPEPGAVDARLSAIQGSPVAEGRRWALLAAGALALVVAAWVVLGGRVEQPAAKVTGTSASEVGGSGAPVPLGSVAELDPSTGEVRTLVPFPLTPQFIDIAHTMAAGLGAVWIVRDTDIVHLDPLHGDTQEPVALPGETETASFSVTTGGGVVWALSELSLFRVNPGSNAAVKVLSLGRLSGQAPFPAQLASAGGWVWVGTSDGKLIRVDSTSRVDPIRTTTDPIDALAADDGGVWALDRLDGVITRFDARTLKASETVQLSADASSMTIDEQGDLWTLDESGGVVTDLTTKASVHVGDDPTGIVAGFGAVWVGDTDGTLRRIDIITNEVTEFPVGSAIAALAVDGSRGSLWVETGSP